MEWSAATAEATQALGLVIEVTKGHEHGVRKHVTLCNGTKGTFVIAIIAIIAMALREH